jgi:hypothetical protein
MLEEINYYKNDFSVSQQIDYIKKSIGERNLVKFTTAHVFMAGLVLRSMLKNS